MRARSIAHFSRIFDTYPKQPLRAHKYNIHKKIFAGEYEIELMRNKWQRQIIETPFAATTIERANERQRLEKIKLKVFLLESGARSQHNSNYKLLNFFVVRVSVRKMMRTWTTTKKSTTFCILSLSRSLV